MFVHLFGIKLIHFLFNFQSQLSRMGSKKMLKIIIPTGVGTFGGGSERSGWHSRYSGWHPKRSGWHSDYSKCHSCRSGWQSERSRWHPEYSRWHP